MELVFWAMKTKIFSFNLLNHISANCSSNQVREAFKNKNNETYGIFHMLVDPLPPLPTYGKFFCDFLLSKKDF